MSSSPQQDLDILPSASRRRRGRAVAAFFRDWLPLLVVLPFPILFLITSLGRFALPIELEWNEGQSAEQALRFARGLPLYPNPDSGWVPYMYAPLYHMVLGWVFWLTGDLTLAWGRLISLVATLLTAVGLFAIVGERTRRAAPGLLAACLYFIWFAPSGYWYDLVRVDSLAYGFGVWGMYFAFRRRLLWWHVPLGMGLLLAAVMTKQTMGGVAAAAAGVLLIRSPRAALFSGALFFFVLLNVVLLSVRGGNPKFVEYTWTNALEHIERNDIYFPNYKPWEEFRKGVAAPGGSKEIVERYAAQWREHGGPELWNKGLRHVAVLVPLIVLWLLLTPFQSHPRGRLYVIPGVLLTMAAISSYAKYGGFLNNFISMYLAFAILVPLAVDGVMHFLPRWARAPYGVVVAAVLALQVTQPWRFPDLLDGTANYEMLKNEPNESRREELMAYANWQRESAMASRNKVTPPEAPIVGVLTPLWVEAARWNYAGVTWFPWQQIPSVRSRRAHAEFMKWLRWKAEQKEPVWVIHHHWYALVAGHPAAMNMDMVRCAAWAGDPVPASLLAELRSEKFRWLIGFADPIQYDWLPLGAEPVIKEKYERVSTLPMYRGATDPSRVFMPLTGAEVRPFTLYRLKGFRGNPDLPPGYRPTP